MKKDKKIVIKYEPKPELAETSTEENKPLSVMIGTPMYGGLSYHGYVSGLIGNILDLRFNNIGAYWTFVANESLITRGRNFLVDQFMKSECTHLMFIDADIHFPEGSIRKLLDADKDIIGAPYPKKGIDWDRINEIIKLNKHIDEPLPLHKFGASYVINYIDNSNPPTPDENGVVEVAHTGTGFMLIKREVFVKLFPYMKQARAANFGKHGTWYTEYFRTDIDESSGVLLSEDWWFCDRWRDIGGKVFLMPEIVLDHIGTYVFTGDLAAAGANIS